MGILERIIAIISEEASKPLMVAIDAIVERHSGRVERKIFRLEDQIMSKFSEYQAAVDSTLGLIMGAVQSESEEIAALVAAMRANDDEAANAAAVSLAQKQGQIIDALAGLSSNIPSPTVATPMPEPTALEPVVVTLPTTQPIPSSSGDPEVPVDVEPSADGVGVNGGFNVDPVDVEEQARVAADVAASEASDAASVDSTSVV